MKLEDQNRQIITNTNNSHEFTIQNNAKMFQILSDKIYTYKIAAIVREISCNAYDSHIEAGIPDTPFRVVLPNELHEYFEIEDFGLGLDEREVYEIYTSYGTSTKTQSNDLIGAFGLGSKTPFAYTTSFTIQTRKDGVEYLFNAYIGNNGAPTCSLLRKRDTEERNGVKIKIPVKSHHRELFMRECKFILSLFPVRPNVVGRDSFTFDLDEDTLKEINDGGITVVDTSHIQSELYQNRRIYAVMGTVCYPVNMQDLSSNISSYLYNYLNEVVLKGRYTNSVFLKFDIGDLDVNAAREGLSIEEGKKTEQNLKAVFEEKLKGLIQADRDKVEECSHPTEALLYLVDKYGDILNFVRGLFDYKGKNLSEYYYRSIESPYGETFFFRPVPSYYSSRSTVQKSIRKNLYEFANYGYLILTARNEKTRGYIKYARELAREHPGTIIVSTDNEVWSDHKINRYETLVGLKAKEVVYLEDLKALDIKDKVKSSKVVNKKPPKKKTEITARSFLIQKNNVTYIQSERIDIDELNDLGYTVLYTEPNPYNDKEVISFERDGKRQGIGLTPMGLLWTVYDKPIRLILSNNINTKSIEQNKIQSLSEFIEDLVDTRGDDLKTAAIISKNFDKWFNDVYFRHSIVIQYAMLAGSVVVSDEIQKYYDLAKNNMNWLQGDYSGGLYANLLGDYPSSFELDYKEIEKELKDTYPMLLYVSSYNSGTQETDAIEYI